jgi:hypothetical protein
VEMEGNGADDGDGVGDRWRIVAAFGWMKI